MYTPPNNRHLMCMNFLFHLILHLECATHSDGILKGFLVEVHINIQLVFGEECFSAAQNIHFVSMGGNYLYMLELNDLNKS